MKKLMVIATLLMTSGFFASNTLAATTEVTWTDYDSYYDVKEGSHNRAKFKTLIFTHFEEHLAELAEKLPKNQTLKIEVTEVDLAGKVMVGSLNSTRIVKNNYPPRMSLSYQLLDADGTVIKAEDVKLRDLSFLSNPPLKYRNKLFGFEKNMLDDWFKDAFGDLIKK